MLTKLVTHHWQHAQTEHRRAVLRVPFALLMFAYLSVIRSQQLLSPNQWGACLWLFVIGISCTLVLAVFTASQPKFLRNISLVGTLIDCGFIAGLLLAGGAASAPFSMLLVAVAIDRGSRSDPGRLLLSATIAGSAMLLALIFSDYWQSQRTLGVGIVITVTLVPLYLARVLLATTQAHEAALRANAARGYFPGILGDNFRALLESRGGADGSYGAPQSPEQRANHVAAIKNICETLNRFIEQVPGAAGIAPVTGDESGIGNAGQEASDTMNLNVPIAFGRRRTDDTRVRAAHVLPAVASATNNIVSIDDPFVRHRKRIPALRILAAGGHSATRSTLQHLLERAGHRCDQVADGAALLGKLAVQKYDAVLLDLELRDMSAMEVLDQIRAIEACESRTPFIVVSSGATRETIDSMSLAGAADFLSWPVAALPLLDTIARLAMPNHDAERVDTARWPATESVQAIVPDMLQELLSLGLDADFLKEFADDSLRDIDIALQRITTAANSGDRVSLREAAHAMKSIAMHLGARSLASTCNESSLLTTGATGQQLRHYAATMQRMVTEVRSQLPAVLDELNQGCEQRDSGNTH